MKFSFESSARDGTGGASAPDREAAPATAKLPKCLQDSLSVSPTKALGGGWRKK